MALGVDSGAVSVGCYGVLGRTGGASSGLGGIGYGARGIGGYREATTGRRQKGLASAVGERTGRVPGRP